MDGIGRLISFSPTLVDQIRRILSGSKGNGAGETSCAVKIEECVPIAKMTRVTITCILNLENFNVASLTCFSVKETEVNIPMKNKQQSSKSLKSQI